LTRVNSPVDRRARSAVAVVLEKSPYASARLPGVSIRPCAKTAIFRGLNLFRRSARRCRLTRPPKRG